MSATTRKRSFAGAAVAVALALSGLVAIGRPEPDARPEKRAPAQPSPAVTNGPGTAARRVPDAERRRYAPPATRAEVARAYRRDQLGSPEFLARERPRALAAAKAWLEGYFAYEAGEDATATGRVVRRHSTRALARDQLRGPARLPAAADGPPPKARIVALEVEFDKPPTTARVRAEVARGTDLAGIGLILTRQGARWLATRVTD